MEVDESPEVTAGTNDVTTTEETPKLKPEEKEKEQQEDGPVVPEAEPESESEPPASTVAVGGGSGALQSILSAEELGLIPGETAKKIESHYEQKLEEFLTAKALCETAKTNVEQLKVDYEKQIEELTLKYQDESSKYCFSQQSIKELRLELEDSKQELTQARDKVRQNDADTARFRRERNEAVNERDTLLNAVERKTLEVERLQADVIALEQKLKGANVTKCEAMAKLEEIQSKEFSLDFKEKRMDKEMSMRDNQIQKLSDDLNRALQDLQNVRRDQNFKALTTDTKLTEKTEELKIATAQIAHLNEQNQELCAKAEDLAAKMHQQSVETGKMMDHYRKELQSQTKLCDLYQEDVEENKKQTEELGTAVSDLKKLLNEASDAYGKLETQQKSLVLKHEKDLEAKDHTIQQLRDELKHANELLKMAKEENLDHAVEKLAPSAAATSRLIKSGMTLTELYTMYVRAAEDLQVEKKENSKLNLQIKNIVQELEERAPELTRQQNEYQNLKDANEEMSLQLNKLIEENADVRSEMVSLQDKVRYLDSENKKFKLERSDLSRQICHLLREIEQMRGGYASEADQSISSDMSANEVITKKLVTFNDIQELQENNVKLLLVVRDFSAKLEELEIAQNAMSQATFEAKIASYNKRLQEMQETQEYQTQMMQQCIQQRDRYKKMYHDAMRSYNSVGGKANLGASLNGSLSGENADAAMDEELPSASTVSAISSEAVAEKEKKIAELESKVKETQKRLTSLKEEYDNYRKEKQTNDKMMNEQFDAMRTEVRELSSKNIKHAATVEYNNEQIKIQQKNVATYKKQISTLEERNKNYETTISKQEATIMYLKDETMSAQSKLARAEVQVENMKHECRILKDAESRLQTEREILNRERQNQSLLLNNLEMIKVTMERSEAEGRIRLETRLDETSRECSALRRRLQEEQDRFRELTTHLERQMQTAKQRMEEEVAIAETVQAELKNARDELEIKSRKIDDLSRKLQETLSPNDEDNPVTQANKKIRELEQKLNEGNIEVESLRKELATAKEHVKQYCNMSESSEKELKDLNELYTTYKTQTETELGTLKKSEADLKAQVEELKTDNSLKKTGEQLTSSTDSESELHKSQVELKEALEKISDNNKDLRELRDKNNALLEQLQVAEQKYANEMVQHSSDIQQLTTLKDEVQKTKLQFDELKNARDQAIERFNTSEECWKNREEIMKKEIDQLEERLSDLNSQNAALHDQIQCLSTKLSITASQAVEQKQAEESMNDSSVAMDDSTLFNKSISEEEKRSVDQLLQIIKFLRKEKDIAVAKFDILRSENVRVQSELMMFQKKLEEAQAELTTEREKSETGIVTAAKHEDILRKLETFNAITDSNRVLREERDNLNKKIKELSERLLKAEDELFPLQEKVRELTVKNESATSENSTLRLEATRWRQRANLLVERSNKTSPEDWKRLQTERENLAKMLTNEKELLKKSSEELNSIRMEKSKLDAEVSNLTKQLGSSTEQNKKYAEELDVLRQAGAKMTTEIGEVKTTLVKRDEDLKKLTDELASKEEQLTDAKSKEQQIRKIAKRYKDSFIELKKKVDEQEGENGKAAVVDGSAEPSGEGSGDQQDKATENNVSELKSQITSSQEEIENLRKENESLKGKLEKAERNQDILKDVKHRILSLTEMKNNVTRELTTAKTQIQSLEHVREENELLKSQFEGRISRITKENADQDKEKSDAINRLTRENEQLTMRMNQLTRQLGIQQGSKPSTSASGSSDKSSSESPRTANVKPIPGPSAQQSATVTPRRGSETPLASIRPMSVQASSRTAAVLPTSQTSNNVAIVQGSSSSSSNTGSSSQTALVPPQQQVHTTGSNNNSNESMSSSPTSSHTDYMPATSSANVAVAAVPPMGTASTSSSTAESSSQQENESIPAQQPNEPGPSQVHVSAGQPSQAIALVSPHIEGAPQNSSNVVAQVAQSSPQVQPPPQEQQNPAPSTSGTSSNAQQIALSSHHQASTSSNTVTTTQAAAGHKRPRDVEGDSSTDTVEQPGEKSAPVNKRTRMQAGEAFQGVSESGLDVEYQVPTSSQRDQEDDIIVVDSEEDEEGMADEGTADEGTAEADDGPFEGYEAEEAYEQDEPEIAGNYDEGEGPDIDEDNVQSANNEVDVDEDNEVPNQSGTSSTTSNAQVAPDVETSSTSVGQSSNAGPSTSSTDGQATESSSQQNANDVQQIQSISSGSGEPSSGPSTSSTTSTAAPVASTSSSTTSSSTSSAASSATAAAASSVTSQAVAASPSQSRRQVNPLARQQQQQLMLMQQNYEESADDRIVPSTPTLYVPRRTDGFSEAVSSPHPQVPNARFTFTEATARSSSSTGDAQLLPEGIDDTRMDLSQLDESGAGGGSRPTGRSVPTTPQQTSPNEHDRAVIHGEAAVPTSNTSSNEAEQAGGEQLAPSGSSVSVAAVEEIAQSEADEPVAGPSGISVCTVSEGEGQVPEITVSAAEDDDDEYDITESTTVEATDAEQLASTSEATAAGVDKSDEQIDEDDLQDIDMDDERDRSTETAGEEESGDGVTSEGERHSNSNPLPMEEGSEADMLETPSSNTRSRSIPRERGTRGRRRFGQRGSTTRNITWSEGRSLNRSGPSASQQHHQQRSPMSSPNRAFHRGSPHQHQHIMQLQSSPPMRRNTRSTRGRRPFRH